MCRSHVGAELPKGSTGESACKPGSVHPTEVGMGDHLSATTVTDGLMRSTREHRTGSPQALAQGPEPPFDLAPSGVYRAASVT